MYAHPPCHVSLAPKRTVQRTCAIPREGKEMEVPRESYRIGFVNKVFPDEKLLEEVLKIAKQLAEKPPASVRLTKELLKKYTHETIINTKLDEFKKLTKQARSREAREVFKAFFEKRKPNFSKFK